MLFLLYHYFAAAEMYNAIRVLIAAYVWMTGFGNFLYYHKTNDFSVVRCAVHCAVSCFRKTASASSATCTYLVVDASLHVDMCSLGFIACFSLGHSYAGHMCQSDLNLSSFTPALSPKAHTLAVVLGLGPGAGITNCVQARH